VDASNLQSQEVWVGTSYTLAACLLQHGLDEAAWNTARGVVESTWQRLGYWFQTPEAWTRDGNFRSLAYMRPLAIWAMQWEMEQRRSGKKRKNVDNIHSKHFKSIRREK
jgi:non-lysosomal glucosylceramidase